MSHRITEVQIQKAQGRPSAVGSGLVAQRDFTRIPLQYNASGIYILVIQHSYGKHNIIYKETIFHPFPIAILNYHTVQTLYQSSHWLLWVWVRLGSQMKWLPRIDQKFQKTSFSDVFLALVIDLIHETPIARYGQSLHLHPQNGLDQ